MIEDIGDSDDDRLQWPQITFTRVALAAVVGVALLWLVPIIAAAVDDIDLAQIEYPYAVILGFVVFDAVLPIFPSEILLNTGSTLAAQDDSTLEVWKVAFAGWLGAVLGDSLLYWLSRTVLRRSMKHNLAKAERNKTVAQAMNVMDNTAPVVIVFGRFVPGVRFAVGATMGLTRFPYRRFLMWDILGGGFWATYTCLFSYLVATIIEDKPIISLAISAAVTTAILALLFRPLRTSWQRAGATQPLLTEPVTH